MSVGVYDALGPLGYGEAGLEHGLVTARPGARPCAGGGRGVEYCPPWGNPSPGISLCLSREGMLGRVWAEGLGTRQCVQGT